MSDTVRYLIISAFAFGCIWLMSWCDKSKHEARERTVQACIAAGHPLADCESL